MEIEFLTVVVAAVLPLHVLKSMHLIFCNMKESWSGNLRVQ